ncbi:MAG: M56 family metallopeptidase, partial [Acidobacteriota bacterium]
MYIHDQIAAWSSWVWPLIANHLWQSALFFILALFITTLLNGAPARVRYLIWCVTLIKFAIPSVLISQLMMYWQIPLSTSRSLLVQSSESLSFIYQVTNAANNINVENTHNEIYCFLSIVWLFGFLLLSGVWLKQLGRFVGIIKREKVAEDGEEVEVFNQARSILLLNRSVGLIVSDQVVEPGVWGIWQSLIMLPKRVVEHLSAAELKAVILHELIHVKRWDNLVNTLQVIFCYIFWFNPLVWVLHKKLLMERELSCDEEVLSLNGAAKVYAISILKVFRLCFRKQLVGLSYITGANSNIQMRVQQIVANNDIRVTLWHGAVVSATVLALVIFLATTAAMLDMPVKLVSGDQETTSANRATSLTDWFADGVGNPKNYQVGIDRNEIYNGKPSVYIRTDVSNLGMTKGVPNHGVLMR